MLRRSAMSSWRAPRRESLARQTGRLSALTPAVRGIPKDYKRGLSAAEITARPASYFVRDPTARAQLEAKERVEARDLTSGPNLRTAPGDPFGLSRGTGLPPIGEGMQGIGLPPSATYAINPLAPGMSFTGRAAGTQIVPGAAVTEVPGDRAAWGQPGLEGLREGMGYIRLQEGYPTSAEAAQRAQVGRRTFLERIAGPYSPEARAALREATSRSLRMGVEPPTIEDVATKQALGQQTRALALARANIAPQIAAAEVDSIPALIQKLNQGDPLETAQQLQDLAAQAKEAGDTAAAEWFRQAALNRMGGRIIEVPATGLWASISRWFGIGGWRQQVVPNQQAPGQPVPGYTDMTPTYGPGSWGQDASGRRYWSKPDGTNIPYPFQSVPGTRRDLLSRSAGNLMDIDEKDMTPEMRARIKAWAARL